jgi:hypothetical protein
MLCSETISSVFSSNTYIYISTTCLLLKCFSKNCTHFVDVETIYIYRYEDIQSEHIYIYTHKYSYIYTIRTRFEVFIESSRTSFSRQAILKKLYVSFHYRTIYLYMYSRQVSRNCSYLYINSEFTNSWK